MRFVTLSIICMFILITVNSSFGASARCVVVEKRGNHLIMDCGERAKGFSKQSKVKIKTDRDKNK